MTKCRRCKTKRGDAIANGDMFIPIHVTPELNKGTSILISQFYSRKQYHGNLSTILFRFILMICSTSFLTPLSAIFNYIVIMLLVMESGPHRETQRPSVRYRDLNSQL